MNACPICGERSTRPVLATLHHLRLYESGNWRFFRGNMAAFGRWRGFWSTVCLISPLFNTLRHWKYRKCRLELATGQPLESAFDKNGCALPQPDEQTP